MSFSVFATSTIALSTKMNSNFYYLGGDRLPYTQTAAGSLTSVDSTYSLGGSAGSKWNRVYCDNLVVYDSIVSSSSSLWVLDTETIATTTSTSITFSGLDGNLAEQYKFIVDIECVSTGTTFLFWIAFNSQFTSYASQLLYGLSAAAIAFGVSAGSADSVVMPLGFVEVSTTTLKAYGIIRVKAGQKRVASCEWSTFKNQTARHAGSSFGVWGDGSSTITSITFGIGGGKSFRTGTAISLWRRG